MKEHRACTSPQLRGGAALGKERVWKAGSWILAQLPPPGVPEWQMPRLTASGHPNKVELRRALLPEADCSWSLRVSSGNHASSQAPLLPPASDTHMEMEPFLVSLACVSGAQCTVVRLRKAGEGLKS